MAARLAILCPGQGGQHPGMFDLALSDPATAAALASWDLFESTGLRPDQLSEQPGLLYENRLAQPLVVAATMAVWLAVRTRLPDPVLAAGYSVGELAAYGIAGALAPAEVVRLAVRRSALMDDCVQPDQPQGMAALSGPDAATLQSLLPADALFPAIETGEANFIVAGRRDALPALMAEVAARGQHATLLPVAVASHTPFMHLAAQAFRPCLEAASWSAPAFPVLSGTSGNAVYRPAQAQQALTEQIEQTIRWSACMDAIAEAGITVALELGPGAALSRMLRERHPQIEARSASEFRSLAGLSEWFRRRYGD